MSNPAAGWYPDPTGQANTIRWWNGTQWTNKTETESPAEPATPPEPVAPEPTPAEPRTSSEPVGSAESEADAAAAVSAAEKAQATWTQVDAPVVAPANHWTQQTPVVLDPEAKPSAATTEGSEATGDEGRWRLKLAEPVTGTAAGDDGSAKTAGDTGRGRGTEAGDRAAGIWGTGNSGAADVVGAASDGTAGGTAGGGAAGGGQDGQATVVAGSWAQKGSDQDSQPEEWSPTNWTQRPSQVNTGGWGQSADQSAPETTGNDPQPETTAPDQTPTTGKSAGNQWQTAETQQAASDIWQPGGNQSQTDPSQSDAQQGAGGTGQATGDQGAGPQSGDAQAAAGTWPASAEGQGPGTAGAQGGTGPWQAAGGDQGTRPQSGGAQSGGAQSGGGTWQATGGEQGTGGQANAGEARGPWPAAGGQGGVQAGPGAWQAGGSDQGDTQGPWQSGGVALQGAGQQWRGGGTQAAAGPWEQTGQGGPGQGGAGQWGAGPGGNQSAPGPKGGSGSGGSRGGGGSGGPGAGGNKTMIVVAAAVGLVLIVVAAVFFILKDRGDHQTADPGTSPTAPVSTGPTSNTSNPTSAPTSQPTKPTDPQNSTKPGQSKNPKLHEGSRIASDAISFPRLRPPWSDRKRLVPQLLNSSGQYVLLQENFDGKNDWYADVFVGALGTGTIFNGNTQATASDLSLQIQSSMYGDIPVTFKPLRNGAVKRSGKSGWYYQQSVTVNSPKVTAKVLLLTVAVFDLGDGTAVAYISDIPTNRPDLSAAESQVYKGINVG